MKHLRTYSNLKGYQHDYSVGNILRPHVAYIDGYGVVYEPKSYPDFDSPFYVEAIAALKVTFSKTYEYSIDGTEWIAGSSSTSISVPAGDRVYFRASGLSASSGSGIGRFYISEGDCNIGGNLMSMLYGEDYRGQTEIKKSYTFYQMFHGQTRIVSAIFLALPATTLASCCYRSMFQGCSSLVNAPELPATTLASYCYNSMFEDCSNLVDAPELPATTLADGCYDAMFKDCSSLVNAPELPAATLASHCYNRMFYHCSRLSYVKALFTTTPPAGYIGEWLYAVADEGTFVKVAGVELPTGASGIPEGWTVEEVAV